MYEKNLETKDGRKLKSHSFIHIHTKLSVKTNSNRGDGYGIILRHGEYFRGAQSI